MTKNGLIHAEGRQIYFTVNEKTRNEAKREKMVDFYDIES